MDLIKKFTSLLDEIADEFVKITDKDGYWSSDYSLWHTEYEAWSVEDMVFIVGELEKNLSRYEGNREEQLEALRNDIEDWIEYNVDVANFDIKYINLRSWLMGCPRVSKAELDVLHNLQNAFVKQCSIFQEIYGKQNDSPQPDHLQELKNQKC